MESQIISDLRTGKIVTFPTETVEGYAVSLNSEKAIKDLMQLKERDFDSDKIFTLVPKSVNDIPKYVIVSPTVKSLISQHIPGELTLILPKNPNFHHFYFDEFLRRGRKIGIGIRIPDHPLFAKILPKTGPLLLTSANPKGGIPRSFTGHQPSTIIDFTDKMPKILRQGNLIIRL